MWTACWRHGCISASVLFATILIIGNSRAEHVSNSHKHFLEFVVANAPVRSTLTAMSTCHKPNSCHKLLIMWIYYDVYFFCIILQFAPILMIENKAAKQVSHIQHVAFVNHWLPSGMRNQSFDSHVKQLRFVMWTDCWWSGLLRWHQQFSEKNTVLDVRNLLCSWGIYNGGHGSIKKSLWRAWFVERRANRLHFGCWAPH